MYIVEYKSWLYRKAFMSYNDAIIYQNALVNSWDITARII